ncbi:MULTISPECIES: hypothetical protein [Microcystis]|uniref:Transposase n=1 Tax=Microcystis wesenbergii NRERC-220 TaxID=3068991 RepID=A0ABU3HNL6_9CHRO|nr:MULTISPECIES: hypothetical protein [Microcystis]MDT3676124.1 hypothetical protein [Microcystis wesenbergii NRERC-220]
MISRSERVATSLTYIGALNLCVLCVFVVRSTRSPAGLYLRIHFTHQTQESHSIDLRTAINRQILSPNHSL